MMTTPLTLASTLNTVQLGRSPVRHMPLAFGGAWFVPYSTPGAADPDLASAMEVAYDLGIRHFDTAASYGTGRSEEMYGQFIKGRRDQIFVASKADPNETTAEVIYQMLCDSLRRMDVETIDLFYIHWPRTGRDLRPMMEGLERARSEGKIGAIGVSNFSVAEMKSVGEVGRIDVHQLGYNLLWRRMEDDVIPYCAANNIAVYAYSTLAHAILTGKFERDLRLTPDDQRNRILPFKPNNWPLVYEAVEEMKVIAGKAGRPLSHLAIRWNLSRPGLTGVVVGTRNAAQALATLPALSGEISDDVFAELTAISDRVIAGMSEADNLFGRVV